jgi:MFS transporter, DHA2 family, multidrug resistance protein
MAELALSEHELAAQPAPLMSLASHQTQWLLLGLGFATGMEFFCNDSMNLVLPDIVGTLGVSPDEGSWILTTYSCSLFLGVPISIWMACHFGYRRYLIGSILVFALASVGCALAQDLPTMLFWRAVQGLAGAGLYVWWRASIYLLMPKPQRSPALMKVSTMLYLSSAAGLLLSGFLTDELSWRLIFLPNLAYASIAIPILLRNFPELPPERHPRLVETDYGGIALLASALVSLQVLLNRGQIDDWFGSTFIQALAWTSAISLALFVFWQASPLNRTPLLRLELMADRRVLSSALIGIFTGIILSSSLYALPEFLRNVASQPHSATRTGQIMCTYALAAAAIRPFVVPLVARIGQRKTIVLALVMLVASMLTFARLLTSDTPDTYYILPLILYAFCLSPLLPSVGSGTVARIEQNQLLDGVSLYMTFRQFGAALGVALITILIEQRETLHSSRLVEAVRSAGALTHDWIATAASTVVARGGESLIEAKRMAVGLLAGAAFQQSATLAYADAFLFMAAIGVVTLVLVPLIPPTPPTPPAPKK